MRKAVSTIGFLLSLICAVGCATDSESNTQIVKTRAKENNMTSDTKNAASILQLSDAEFFGFNDEIKSALTDALADHLYPLDDDSELDHKSHLALAAPERVSITTHNKIPVVIGTGHTGLRRWQVNPVSNLYMLAMHKPSGTLIRLANIDKGRRMPVPDPSAQGTPPNDAEANAASIDVISRDIYTPNQDFLTSGEWSIVMLEYDTLSNHITIDIESTNVTDTPVPSVSPFVKHFQPPQAIMEHRVKVVHPEQSSANYFMRVALSIANNVPMLKDQQNTLYYPLNIVLVQLDKKPVVVPLTIPIIAFEVNSDTVYNVVFEIDLSAAVNVAITSGTSLAYIVTAQEWLGPYQL